MSAILHRNAKVDIVNSTKQGRFDLVINDSFVHHLTTRDMLHRAITATNVDVVRDNLQGGHFLERNGILAEYRDNSYTGFIQPDEFIDRFSNIKNLNAIATQKLNIEKYGVGGAFDLTTGFDWSVFSRTLDTTVGLVRLVCANGMTVNEKILEKKVPIINMFERHLQIASDQVMHYAERHLTEKLVRMEHEVASVREVNQVMNHINYRRPDNALTERLDRFEAAILGGHLENYYTKDAISNAAIAETLPSHLDRYTLFNMVTEMRSHTEQSDRSTSRALDMLASSLMLNDSTISVGANKTPAVLFANPERAFIGV